MATIREILNLTPEERHSRYKANDIHKVIIDGNEFTDYTAFSFLYEKSYINEPKRDSAGSLSNLDTYPWFLTPHLKIDFALLSIDAYRTLMQLIYSKNEFEVTCYDVVYNKRPTHKMYFTTEEMPNLWTVVDIINGNSDVELLGVKDLTVEMVGTNNPLDSSLDDTITITFDAFVDFPVLETIDSQTTTVTIPRNTSLVVGNSATIRVNEVLQKISDTILHSSPNNYPIRLKAWQNRDSYLIYKNGTSYLFREDVTLRALWERVDSQ